MRRLALALALWLITAPAFAFAANYWNWTKPAAHHAAIVRVNTGGFAGTGTLIRIYGNKGLVLTADHIGPDGARKPTSYTATWPNGYSSTGRVLGRDQGNDLVIFEVEPPTAAPTIPVASQAPPPGAVVEYTGYGGPGNQLRHFTGTVRTDSTTERLVSDANLLSGDSGGGVIYNGELVGVITGGYQVSSIGLLIGGQDWTAKHPAMGSNVGPIRQLLGRVCPPGAT